MPGKDSASLALELLDVQRTLGWMDLIIGSIDDAVFVTDNKQRIVFANQYFSDLLSIPRVFLLGQYIDNVFTINTIDEGDSVTSPFKATDDSPAYEQLGTYEWRSADRKRYIFRVSRRSLQTTGQAVYLAQNISDDYEAAQVKNSFIDLASHQLRTPMTAVMTYAHMLQDGFKGELTSGQKELSIPIIRAAERMNHLVDELLTITRLQNNQESLNLTSIPLTDLFERISSELQPQLEVKKLKFSVHFVPKAAQIYSDKQLVHEVISNLIVNSAQYTPDHGTIAVSVRHQPASITIAISDTGIGIPKDYMPHMFKQFSRADNALSVNPEGTGLGLYVIKLMLDKIGASIKCVSSEGVGTTFSINFPVAANS